MYNVVGKSVLKEDAFDKVKGITKFAADLQFDDMLYAKVLRSKVPSGILISVDTSEAKKLSGVYAVVTREDVPGENTIGIVLKDEPVFIGVNDKIRKVGDPIAAVAAESEEIAERALELIKYEIEEQAPITDIFDAMKEGKDPIHGKSNILTLRKINKGDVDTAFSKCSHIVENEYKTQMVDHSSIETEAGIAKMEGDSISVWCSTQNVHYDRKDISRALNIPLHKVRVVQAFTGGGFGGKLDMSVQIHIALLAIITKRPVKLVYTRAEHTFCTPKRHPYIIKSKLGADAEGKLIALTCDIYGDTGAYASYGPAVLTRAAIHCTGPYEIPHVRSNAYAVFTNNPQAGAMRGFGVPQVVFAMESQIEILAEKIGISSYEIRKLNALIPGSKTSTGQTLEQSVGILETLETAKAKADKVMDKKHGIGMACMKYGIGNTGLPNPAGAFVEFYEDGTAVVLTGCADIGQGSNTVLAQIAAEELGLDACDIKIISADTAMTPDAGATSASRQTYISGNAVRLAAKEAKQEVLKLAGAELGVSFDKLAIKNKVIYVKGMEDKNISLIECLNKCRGKGILTQGSGWFNPDTVGLDLETGQGKPYATYAYATQIVEVEVDVKTGVINVLNIVASHDVGTAINPKNVEGQIEGGCAFGLGYALMEDIVVKDSKIMNPTFANYLIPTSLDMPKVYPIIVQSAEETGPFGAKGVGEPTLIPTAAAISNAVYDAIGIRFTELPLTPQKVLEKINAK